jgi:5S rRNA maturation endonuclease (ribonuclease M5)
MRAPPEVRLEKLQKLIERISFESQKGSIIVVEGPHDRESLRKLAVSGTILCLQNSRMNTTRFAEQLNKVRGVLILTDFDRQGVFLAKNLTRALNSQRVRTNVIVWRDLRRLTRSEIRSIEELPGLYQRLQIDSLRIHAFRASPLRRDMRRQH